MDNLLELGLVKRKLTRTWNIQNLFALAKVGLINILCDQVSLNWSFQKSQQLSISYKYTYYICIFSKF